MTLHTRRTCFFGKSQHTTWDFPDINPRHYRPQRSWGKVIFSEVCVKNSVHRGWCLPHCMLGCTPPGQRQTPPGAKTDTPLPEQTAQKQTPPPPAQCKLGSNKRAVRILLECIYQSRPPRSKHPPPPGTVQAGQQQAGGTHPTGMHISELTITLCCLTHCCDLCKQA